MATYAIGDLQGCYREFVALLEALNFSEGDQLWLVGDLINRGPDSLATLRRVKALGTQAQVVLGNHDLHFLATYYAQRQPTRSDTFDELLAAPDVDELAEWMRAQKLLVLDETLGYAMTHAGIPHIWTVQEAQQYALEVEAVLAGRNEQVDYLSFFRAMYGNVPDIWSADLIGIPRYRMITNYLTRLRLIDRDGRMDFAHKGSPDEASDGWSPWYTLWGFDRQRVHLLFGHWAAIDGRTERDDIIGVDTGCVWGRRMTAYNLHNGERTSIPAMGSDA